MGSCGPQRLAYSHMSRDRTRKYWDRRDGTAATLDRQGPEIKIAWVQLPRPGDGVEPLGRACPIPLDRQVSCGRNLQIVASLSRRNLAETGIVDPKAITMLDEAADGIRQPAGRKRATGQAHSALQGSFGDRQVRPKSIHELVLRHHPTCIPYQVGQKVKDARLNLLCRSTQPQRARLLIELEWSKVLQHRGSGGNRNGDHKRKISRW